MVAITNCSTAINTLISTFTLRCYLDIGVCKYHFTVLRIFVSIYYFIYVRNLAAYYLLMNLERLCETFFVCNSAQ